MEETKKVEWQYIGGRERGLLRDKGYICERCVNVSRSLLSAKSDMLDPETTKRRPQRPAARALITEPTE